MNNEDRSPGDGVGMTSKSMDSRRAVAKQQTTRANRRSLAIMAARCRHDSMAASAAMAGIAAATPHLLRKQRHRLRRVAAHQRRALNHRHIAPWPRLQKAALSWQHAIEKLSAAASTHNFRAALRKRAVRVVSRHLDRVGGKAWMVTMDVGKGNG